MPDSFEVAVRWVGNYSTMGALHDKIHQHSCVAEHAPPVLPLSLGFGALFAVKTIVSNRCFACVLRHSSLLIGA